MVLQNVNNLKKSFRNKFQENLKDEFMNLKNDSIKILNKFNLIKLNNNDKN